ncbi:MAG: HD domain-containing protein [Acidobacteria bacterium]|nr:HD domain-containing protein [Acidobacteriota bacterium]
MPPKLSRFSIFSQPLDRAAFVAYFLGGVVPLVTLVLVIKRYAGAALLRPGLGGLILSLALLSLASFFVLQRTTRQSVGRAQRHSRRLASLVDASRSLAQTADRDGVVAIATRCAAALTGATAAYFLAFEKTRQGFSVLRSIGPEAEKLYSTHREEIDEMAALALPEDSEQQEAEIVHGEIATLSASAIGVGAGVRTQGALILVRQAAAEHDPAEVGTLTALARLVTVALGNSDLRSQQRNFFAHVTQLLVSTLDAHLDYQTDHSRRVAQLANRIGRAMRLPESQLRSLHFAALLHDIGMLRIDRDSLREGRTAVEKHPVIGFDMLRQIDLWRGIAPFVRHHHEHFDGNGYPDQLRGEAIPLESRMIAVAEAFDSMTSAHSYRAALPQSEALSRIRQASGKQFDPAVVEIFLDLAARGELDVNR